MIRKSYLILATALLALLFVACRKETHFITDKQYREQVHADYLARTELAATRSDILFAPMDSLGHKEREAMEFLYAYMPYSDLADYDYNYFLGQVRSAFLAQETFSWGKVVPEDIFRHFVLPYRVNNENLDTARQLMFRELKGRVEGLSMEQAALEVNHWCHEHVAYRGADSRTSAPLATLRTALGRCGEESTFTVAALRSVGIPAQQCYTPRWAHCDDNHAWVEVWVIDDSTKRGEWKFLGACEPDPLLNMGWFAVPSTRCMMVHTKAFGRYHGDEEVVKASALFSELNLLSHYAPTCRLSATVTDTAGKPVPDASVKFKLYNYAEYYTLADITADKDGKASITTGFGDLLIWATDGKRYGYIKADTRKDTSYTIILSRTAGEEYAELLDIVPPAAGIAKTEPSTEQKEANNARIKVEDSLRNAYTSTFLHSATVDCNMSQAQVDEILTLSEGNHEEIITFIKQAHDFPFLYDYLRSFSDKDLRDSPAEVLLSHLTEQPSDMPLEVYKKGILPARIANELVREWRRPLAEELHKLNLTTLESLQQWIAGNIAVDDTGNYYHCPISPMGVMGLRHSDAHSRDIFFVAGCRSLGIPSYLDNATNTIYVWQKGQWTSLSLDPQQPKAEHSCRLTLTYKGKEPAKPIYWPHFTLQHFEEGDFNTYDFEDDSRLADFPATLALEPGYYCLSTGNRDSEGNVRSRLYFFTLKAGEKRSLEIILRSLDEKIDNLPSISPDLEIVADMATVKDYAGENGMLFVSLGDYREPSKHLVKELIALHDQLEQWGGMIYMLVPEGVPAMSWDIPNSDISLWRADNKDLMENAVKKALDCNNPTYPLFAAIDNKGNILYHSDGYKIGSAEQALRSLSKK